MVPLAGGEIAENLDSALPLGQGDYRYFQKLVAERKNSIA
jgi:hypothetical protein